MHTITYKLNGGTYQGSAEDIVETHALGDTIKIHEAPDEREGYTFAYWKGSEYQPGDDYTIEGDHDFTAVWTKNKAAESDEEKEEKKSVSPIPAKERKANISSAETGDHSDILLWLLLMTLSGAAVTWLAVASDRRRFD